MALLFFEGFESIDGPVTDPSDLIIDRRFTITDPEDVFVYDGAYADGLCIQYHDTGGSIQYYAGPDSGNVSTVAEKIWCMDIFVSNEFRMTTSAYAMWRWVTDTSQWACHLRVYLDGTALLASHDNVSQAISRPRCMKQNCWNRVECKLICHPTAGTFEMKVNGETVISATGIDTGGITGTSHTRAYCYSQSGILSTSPRYDNIRIYDTTGNTNNDFMGPQTVVALYADADNVAEWTPLSGNTNYEMVDENPCDESTSYISETTSLNVASFNSEALPSNTDTVFGVRLTADARLSVNGTESYKQLIESGGTEYPASISHDLTLATAWVYQDSYWEFDPDTSAAWTINGVDSAKFGVEMQ